MTRASRAASPSKGVVFTAQLCCCAFSHFSGSCVLLALTRYALFGCAHNQHARCIESQRTPMMKVLVLSEVRTVQVRVLCTAGQQQRLVRVSSTMSLHELLTKVRTIQSWASVSGQPSGLSRATMFTCAAVHNSQRTLF